MEEDNMKAARWYGPNDVRIDEVPEPMINKDEVKIKIKWCGFCGTDIHEYVAGPIFIPGETEHPYTKVKAPVILGHEFSGEVVEIGSNVDHVKVGDAVTVEPLITCGECPNCRKGLYHLCSNLAFHGLQNTGGAFAEYTSFRKDRVHKLPEGVSYEMGALVEPVTVGLHGVKMADFKIGQTAVVVGAGPIGLAVIENLKVAGAKTIICVELSTARKEFAKIAGADVVLDPREVNVVEEVQRLTDGLGADASFEVTGVQAGFDTAVDAITSRGTVVILSIWEKDANIMLNKLVIGEKKIVGSIVYSNEYDETLKFMADKRIQAKGWITKKIHLDELVTDGFATLLSGEKDKHVKILVTPDRDLLD
jgi:(R,R)-butanediol dehydrogenase/meso-butanediol dehydrogenase/diacetyl reductase